jgi:hypothetical protein
MWQRCVGRALLLAAVFAVTAGCSTAVAGAPTPVAPAWGEDGPPATGSADLATACPLPISFTLADAWTATPFHFEPGDRVAELFRHGPFDVACEADARPTGDIGFLRVYTSSGPSAGPRGDLMAFVAGENPRGQESGSYRIQETTYTELDLGGYPAAQVVYRTGEDLDLAVAFAVAAPRGPVVVQLDGLDAEDLRPAYELAMRTVRVP